MKANIISLEKCKYYFDFDDQGNLYWKESRGGNVKGSIAGCLTKFGYYQVGIENKSYMNHRILYQLYHNIELENEFIDHIDGNKTNNSKENLRLCTKSENNSNRKVGKNNKSTGIKNIYIIKYKDYEYYYIKINKNKKIIYSELFRTNNYTLDDIIKIRDEQLKIHHGDFYNLG